MCPSVKSLLKVDVTMKRISHPRAGNYAWLAILGGAVVYEFAAEDLLSESTSRACQAHPLLARIFILAVAGHLACVIPPAIDLLSAKNLVHQGLVKASGIDRRKHAEKQAA